MTARELYELIKKTYPGLASTLCGLHKPCREGRRCLSGSSGELVDFDQVERLHHAGMAPKPSVDGVAVNSKGTCFCFVEIKGWEMFLEHAEVTEGKIEKQVEKYDLQGKLDNSLCICTELSRDGHCFDEMPFVYVLVTDIEVEKDPLESLAFSLEALAETSSKWFRLCNDALRKKLMEIGGVRKRYVNCRDFDSLLKNL